MQLALKDNNFAIVFKELTLQQAMTVTYNFDPDKWYENELLALRSKYGAGKMTPREYELAVEALNRKQKEMWERLDGSYQIPNKND